MKVTFKNGKELVIAKEQANTLMDNIVRGCKKFQCFSDDKEVFLIINLEEVVCIEPLN